METSAGAWWKEQTISFLILYGSVKSDPAVWEHFKHNSQRKHTQVLFKIAYVAVDTEHTILFTRSTGLSTAF